LLLSHFLFEWFVQTFVPEGRKIKTGEIVVILLRKTYRGVGTADACEKHDAEGTSEVRKPRLRPGRAGSVSTDSARKDKKIARI